MDDNALPPRLLRVGRGGADGLTYAQTRAKRFTAPSRGVRIDSHAEEGTHDAIDAAVLGARDDAVITDIDAARVWGLPLAPWLGLRADRPVSLAVAAGDAKPRRRGVRGRRLLLPDEHVVELDGRRITTPERTWLDCAAEMPLEYVVAMGDAGLARGIMHERELGRMLQWAFRRRGVGVARRAFPLLDPAAASPGESLVRVHLINHGVPRPECNVDIFDDTGGWLARGDLVLREYRLVVEYDGLVHLDEGMRRRDAQRRNLLQEHGWIVITATAADLAKPWILAGQVLAALRSRGWQPPR